MSYRVNTVYPTIQGEGCQTGVPMVLVRLQGCAVGCPWCDTKETWDPSDGRDAGLSALIAEVRSHPGPRWVLVTGGEPADQDLRPLVSCLQSVGYKVAIETSGTALGHVSAGFDWVCVSPKIDMPGGKPILRDAVAPADEIKYVVGKAADVAILEAFLAEFGPFKPSAEVCLQPLSQSEKATKLCVETAMARGWRLSIQAHKSIGLP